MRRRTILLSTTALLLLTGGTVAAQTSENVTEVWSQANTTLELRPKTRLLFSKFDES